MLLADSYRQCCELMEARIENISATLCLLEFSSWAIFHKRLIMHGEIYSERWTEFSNLLPECLVLKKNVSKYNVHIEKFTYSNCTHDIFSLCNEHPGEEIEPSSYSGSPVCSFLIPLPRLTSPEVSSTLTSKSLNWFCLFYSYLRGWQIFSVKGKIVNIQTLQTI